MLNTVTAIAVVELVAIISLSVMYAKKAHEIKYFKPIEIYRKDSKHEEKRLSC